MKLIFLQGNGVYFYENTTDPWYRATQFGPGNILHNGSNPAQNVFQPEEAASPLACLEKYQFCNAHKECGSLSAFLNAVAQAAPLFNMTSYDLNNVPNDPVGSRFFWYFTALFGIAMDLDEILKRFGPKTLQSQESLLGGVMGPLPDNQWQLDVTYWWATKLAGMQAAFVNTAYNTGNTSQYELITRPYNSHMQEMCNNQVKLPHFPTDAVITLDAAAETKTNNMRLHRKSKALTTHPSVSLDYTSPT